MGPYGNNAYIVRDTGAHAGLLVDMPLEEGPLLAAIAAEGRASRRWSRPTGTRTTGRPTTRCARRPAPRCWSVRWRINIPEERIDGRLSDGQELRVGGIRVQVLHTPGHTRGSISLRVGRAVITGDTLFDGGPGRTSAAGDLETILASIDARLLPLPAGDGRPARPRASTTIARVPIGARAVPAASQAAVFFGDVEWRG